MIVPKFAAPCTAFGAPRFAVFSRLNTSARSSIARLPPSRHAPHQREIDVAVRRPAHRIARGGAERELIGATANAAVLNQRAGVRSSAGSVGSPTRFGRCVAEAGVAE